MLIPEMVSRGYPRAFATALITCSSILGVLIPPSTPMIIFGWVTGTNVLACFLSTVGPGIITIIIFCGINFVLSRRFDLKLMPQLSKTEKRRQIGRARLEGRSRRSLCPCSSSAASIPGP